MVSVSLKINYSQLGTDTELLRAFVRAVGRHVSGGALGAHSKGACQWEYILFFLPLAKLFNLSSVPRERMQGSFSPHALYCHSPYFLEKEKRKAWQSGRTRALSRRARLRVGRSKRQFLQRDRIIASRSCIFLQPLTPCFGGGLSLHYSPSHVPLHKEPDWPQRLPQGGRGGARGGREHRSPPRVGGSSRDLGTQSCLTRCAGALIHTHVACYCYSKKRAGATYFFH